MNYSVGISGRDYASLPGTLGHLAKHKLRVGLAISLIACDLSALILGTSIAGAIRFGNAWSDVAGPEIVSLIPIYLLSAGAVRACSGEALIYLTQALKRGVLAFAVSVGVLLYLLLTNRHDNEVSRIFLSLSILFAATLLVALRTLHTYYARRRLEGQLYDVTVLHDGDFPISPGGTFPINVSRAFESKLPDAKDYDHLAGMLARADRVVVKCPPSRRDLWAHVLQGMNVHGEIFAPDIANLHAIGIGSFAGRPTYIVAKGPLNLRDRLLKRAFDMIVATAGLLALGPLLGLTAIAIKIDSPGPVFFRQKRIGRQNRLFDIFKFRSMRVEQCDEEGVQSTSRDDRRITRVGRFLRQTSIDELPQLLNVLKGDMSIVGPRPHAVHSTAKSKLFWEVDKRYWYRHACKPGITGLAQIRGFRGATNEERDLTDRLEADLEYLGRWSIWSDFAIVLRTLSVLVHRNAY